MFDAPGDQDEIEYIEILNFGGDTVSLAGWTVDGDVTFNLPGLSLLPNGTLVITKNKKEFDLAFGTPSFQWPGTQQLGDESGQVRLFSGLNTLIDVVNYSNTAPWPEITPGTVSYTHLTLPTTPYV